MTERVEDLLEVELLELGEDVDPGADVLAPLGVVRRCGVQRVRQFINELADLHSHLERSLLNIDAHTGRLLPIDH